jgi:TPR repeat protein
MVGKMTGWITTAGARAGLAVVRLPRGSRHLSPVYLDTGGRSVKLELIARGLALVVAWSAAEMASAAAGSPEEDFRGGLSAFNGGDFAAAMRLWRPLADRDDPRSQAGVGFLYHRGLGVKTDDVEAAYWLRKAAEQGQAEGQLMLGSLYFFGLGVPQSYPTAYAWCELAQDNGQAEAQMCCDAALQSLTEDAQLQEAFGLVRQFRTRFGPNR